METPIRIAAAASEDYEWCARVMASTEPASKSSFLGV